MPHSGHKRGGPGAPGPPLTPRKKLLGSVWDNPRKSLPALKFAP